MSDMTDEWFDFDDEWFEIDPTLINEVIDAMLDDLEDNGYI